MATIPEIIAAHPFSEGLEARYLHLLQDHATGESFDAHEIIFREGGDADCFYLLHWGRVALQTFVPASGAATVQTLAPGEALGWTWLFPPYRWLFSAVAVEPVEAVAIAAPKLRAAMEENHDFGYAITRRVARLMLDRLHATRVRLLEACAGGK